MQFDHDVVGSHDELLEQIRQAKQPGNACIDLLSRIDRWERTTINKINRAAERARQQINQLVNSQTETLKEQFETLSKEVRRRRKDEDFAEDDVKHLRERINQLQQTLEQLTRADNTNVTIMENDQIDWNRIIYLVETTEPSESTNEQFRQEASLKYS